MKFKLFFYSLLLSFTFSLISCKSIKESKKVREAEKQEITRQKEAEEEYQQLVDAHMNRQTERTIERMEETKKRSEYYNRSKGKTLLQRILGINPKHKKPKKKKDVRNLRHQNHLSYHLLL